MKKRPIGALIVAANIILIGAVVMFFFMYSSNHTAKLREENLNNIRNLNQSASNIAASYFETRREKIADMVLYIESSDLTLEEALKYVNASTSAIAMNNIQFVSSDFLGVSAMEGSDGFIPVDYSNSDYGRLQKIFTDADTGSAILSTPEFTDGFSATRSFALYTHVSISGEAEPYTLLMLAKSSDIIELINIEGGYDDMSTVIIDGGGDYVLSNKDFKAMNFYDYLYSYNGLSLDERNAVMDEVTAFGSGEVFFRDARGRDCVFRYTDIAGSKWQCVTVVPLSSFHMTDYRSSVLLMALFMAFLLVVDVGWLLMLNRRTKRSMEREQQANSAKSEFLSRMSHDIRTPLNGIIGSTILAMELNNPPETAKYLTAIDASGKFLLGLVNDVLDMSKVESGKMTISPEPYRPSELRDYLNAVILPLARSKDVEFTVTITNDDRKAYLLDRLRFNQICFNLLSNAVKYTPKGGHVAFSVTAEPVNDDTAAIEITVKDDGIGMSDDFQKHMFEAFSQEDRQLSSISGTGLGLAIVKNLVDLMQGNISCESAENAGTLFRISLRAGITDAAPDKVAVTPSDDDNILEGMRVLLCEDNDTNCFIAVELLKKRGIIAEIARNGREGADMFASSSAGYYDAVLMDIMMPVLDGLGATREIRASKHADATTVPIIAMTANAYTSDIAECTAAGMNAHIAKPIDPPTLFATLKAEIAARKR